MNCNACDILLTLPGRSLEVWQGLGHDLAVKYAGSLVRIADTQITVHGEGRSFDEACTDYLGKIRGKVLAFEDGTEVRVLG